MVACMFVGYNELTKAFKLYLLDKKKIAITKDVIFDEDKFSLKHFASCEPLEHTNILNFSMSPDESLPNFEHDVDHGSPLTDDSQREQTPKHTDPGEPHGDSPTDSDVVRCEHTLSHSQAQSLPRRSALPTSHKYPVRNRKPSSRLQDYYVNYLAGTDDADPLSYAHAITNPKWAQAISQKKKSILKMNTREYIPLRLDGRQSQQNGYSKRSMIAMERS
jgi:hypothetical protein